MRDKRKLFQWTAFVIVLFSSIIRLVLEVTGISRSIEYSTLTAVLWTGYGLGIIVALTSFLFPSQSRKR